MKRRGFIKSVAGAVALGFSGKVGDLRAAIAKARTPNYSVNPEWESAPFEVGFCINWLDYKGDWTWKEGDHLKDSLSINGQRNLKG